MISKKAKVIIYDTDEVVEGKLVAWSEEYNHQGILVGYNFTIKPLQHDRV